MSITIGNNVAFIPLRGGSKSIPLKNIKSLCGRPLVYWVLDAVNNCTEIDKIIVATDSIEIKEVVQNYDSDKILVIDRSSEVSTDSATTESVMLEFAKEYDFNNIILVQATSPLLETDDISKGLSALKVASVDSVLSVVRQKRFIWGKDLLSYKPLNYNPASRPRRQDFDGQLVENGAFYITSRKSLLSSECRISGKIDVVEMDERSYIEIDEPSDWSIVEAIIRKKKHKDISTRIKNLKCVLTDCDGVLTDGGMYYSESGDELKKFSTRDGMGFQLLKAEGFITGIITGEKVRLVENRAKKLNVDEIHLGIQNKMEIVNQIIDKHSLSLDEVAYIGDDINDLEVICKVGLGCTVSDGVDEVKTAAEVVTVLSGGQGAFREIVDLILETRGE